MSINDVDITIDYILTTGERDVLHVDPKEYFDPPEEYEGTDADIDVDSPSRLLELHEYFPADTPLKQARLRVRNNVTNELLEKSQSYWSEHGVAYRQRYAACATEKPPGGRKSFASGFQTDESAF
ncbi:hypothetical protein [Chondromyces crocatus]|uniref:Uncharacterized protein n=1 Tax=Chondromyces crocatus TaxID=52 RepID=A0A0K1EBT3_CHOCO|nr:hypothetical protein [Chondromyces crocatus]AKT38325.1 uncharacterized protein CMC5_024700 [Chondromyces crocatus]